MATQPAFTAVPRTAVANISAGNTNRDGTGTVPTVFTAGANGSKIERVVVKAEDDPADCVVILWLFNAGSTYMFDEFDLDNPADAGTTVTAYRAERKYDDLVLASGWSLMATLTVAPTAGDVNVIAFGGDY